ncbi:hypothetical protein POWCR01_000165900 [Plasmodium ovale]|uniref:PIR protein n=1 Tax=Plasmodium ovale TaxID=36330 RepID=A0A1C3KJ83_PLAOA|nr:hypothetical protein POWCR01_000165900 [Plasmodium ovale]
MSSTHDSVYLYKKLLEEYKKDSSLFKIHECNVEYISNDIIIELKELYNIYDRFQNLAYGNVPSGGSNSEYAPNSFNLYSKYIEKCNGHNIKFFCDVLEKFRKANEYDIKLKKCSASIKILPFSKENYLSVII